jgi:uncharacterized damage-inducible protein DinB
VLEERERLSEREAEGWRRLSNAVDRLRPEDAERPDVTPDGWSVRDLLWHLRIWTEEAATQLAAVRSGTYRELGWETDEINAVALVEGRRFALPQVLAALERSRARFLAGWSSVDERSAPGVEWFDESGAEHYEEHLPELEAFVDGAGHGPDDSLRRAAKEAAEQGAWTDINALIDAAPFERLELPGVTPAGWSVKDTMWHVARWCEDAADGFERMRAGTFEDEWEDDQETEALNQTWFEESQELDLATVRAAWFDQRSAMLRGFAAMPQLTSTAEEWFDESGAIHYEKHLIDLRPWLADEAASATRSRA